MFAIHSDDKGLVLPPKIAQNKIVIIPLMFEKNKKILEKAEEIKKKLSKYNPILDNRLEVTPGWKYNEWELKGIPLRIELGPRDLEKKEVVIIRRDNGKKISVKINNIKNSIDNELKDIQENIFRKAQEIGRASCRERV